jgi:hypothetical protein
MIMIHKILGVFFSIGMLLAAAGAQPSVRPFRELTFNVAPTKSTFVPLEPIPLRFVLENRTDSRIWSHGNLTFHTAHVKIAIVQPSGSVIADIGRLSVALARTITADKEVLPGSRHELLQVLAVGLERHFDEIGEYKIKATFQSSDGTQTISSGWATFEIVEPAGTNLAAYDLLKRRTDLSTFFFGYDDETFQDAEMFVSLSG